MQPINDWERKLSLPELMPAARCGAPDPMTCWVIADTHFFHVNLRGYTGRPEGVDEVMAQRWRERVGPSDTVVHLGDLAFRHADLLEALLPTLPGRLLLLKGNHDRQKDTTYARLGITLISPCTVTLGDWTLALTHAPHPEVLESGAERVLNVHGHIHERLAPDLRLLNVGVEWTGYAPVRLREVALQRIGVLASRVEGGSFTPPLGYADWLAETYGGEVQRSDLTRFTDREIRDTVREQYEAYRLAQLAGALKNGTAG